MLWPNVASILNSSYQRYVQHTRHFFMLSSKSYNEPFSDCVSQSFQTKDASVVLFPGQGTQYVGMGKNLLRFPKARSIFQLANEVLKYDVLKVCLDGPKEKLDSTEFTQPAVMVICLAAVEQLRAECPKAIENCIGTAGFSLGELTALVFAGAIPLDKALKLVQVRATAMQAACDRVKSGMTIVRLCPNSEINEACNQAQQWCLKKGIENPTCTISNYLYPQCRVIAGNIEALDYLQKNMKNFKIRRMTRLTVGGAFHTQLMVSAVKPFSKALNSIELNDPLIKVYSNVDGKTYRNSEHIRKQLPKQIVKPVKWEQVLHMIYDRKQDMDFPRTFECGPGTRLKRILGKVNCQAYNSAFNIEA